jgi:hypothetical protein
VILVVCIVAGVVVLTVVAAFAVAVFGFGLNPGFIALIAALAVFALISFGLRFVPQGMPGLRLARSVVGFLMLAALAGVLYLFVYPAAQTGFRSLPGNGAPAVGVPSTSSVTVVYEVTGTAPTATITQSPSGDASTADSTATPQPIPFSRTFTVTGSPASYFSLSASTESDDESATLSCTITVDGKVIAHDSEAGSVALVICGGTAKG